MHRGRNGARSPGVRQVEGTGRPPAGDLLGDRVVDLGAAGVRPRSVDVLDGDRVAEDTVSVLVLVDDVEMEPVAGLFPFVQRAGIRASVERGVRQLARV